MSPPPPSPRRRRRAPRCRRLLLSVASLLLLLSFLHASAALLRRANVLGRRCSSEYSLQKPFPLPSSSRPRIAMVSFSAEGAAAGGRHRRSFGGVAEAVGGNKRAYAARWGYGFVDARDLVDPRRPPNWSKIPAVRSHLGAYDWVFWNDADTVVTNPNVPLENILYSAIGHSGFHGSPDLVVTEDFNGVNSGVFFVRRSQWSKKFLDTWWNQTSFIRFGSTKSGDNDAMKHLIDSLPPKELQEHVFILPMQCLFNSYPWFPSWKNNYRLIVSPWTIWKGVFSDGDFMVHLAGLDEKKKWAVKILGELRVAE